MSTPSAVLLVILAALAAAAWTIMVGYFCYGLGQRDEARRHLREAAR